MLHTIYASDRHSRPCVRNSYCWVHGDTFGCCTCRVWGHIVKILHSQNLSAKDTLLFISRKFLMAYLMLVPSFLSLENAPLYQVRGLREELQLMKRMKPDEHIMNLLGYCTVPRRGRSPLCIGRGRGHC